jgi:hypothetical protein
MVDRLGVRSVRSGGAGRPVNEAKTEAGTMSGRTRWKAEREVALSREQLWFLKGLCDLSRRSLPAEGVGSPARSLIDEVERKLSRALEPRHR